MENYWRRHSVCITRIPVLLTMAMIYWFSAQNGTASGNLSGNLTKAVLDLFLDLDRIDPVRLEEILNGMGTVIRKLGHFTEFALLGFFLQLHILQLGKKRPIRHIPLWAWGTGVLYAITDELHQGFVGGRHPAVTDVLIDGCGVLAGIGLLLLVLRLKKKLPVSKEKDCLFPGDSL